MAKKKQNKKNIPNDQTTTLRHIKKKKMGAPDRKKMVKHLFQSPYTSILKGEITCNHPNYMQSQQDCLKHLLRVCEVFANDSQARSKSKKSIVEANEIDVTMDEAIPSRPAHWLVLGVNSCSRWLSRQLEMNRTSLPSGNSIMADDDNVYLFLCLEDSNPLPILNHFPVLASLAKVPYIILPSGSVSSLTKKLKIPTVSCLLLRGKEWILKNPQYKDILEGINESAKILTKFRENMEDELLNGKPHPHQSLREGGYLPTCIRHISILAPLPKPRKKC